MSRTEGLNKWSKHEKTSSFETASDKQRQFFFLTRRVNVPLHGVLKISKYNGKSYRTTSKMAAFGTKKGMNETL